MNDTISDPISKVTHNTVALEQAILSTVKAASAPAYRAIAEAQFLRAKALLFKTFAVCALIICVATAFIFVWQIITKGTQKLSLIAPKTEVQLAEEKQETVSNQQENELREILKSQTLNDPTVETKKIRSIGSSSKLARDLLNPASSIGSLTAAISENSSNNRTASAEPVIIENMIVGPEVQILTVFKEREIGLANGLDVKIVAGHRYANNSSTSNWREGYCYVTWFNELVIRVDVATKPGKNAAAVNAYVMPKELEMLGGKHEVDKLSKLCPWLQ